MMDEGARSIKVEGDRREAVKSGGSQALGAMGRGRNVVNVGSRDGLRSVVMSTRDLTAQFREMALEDQAFHDPTAPTSKVGASFRCTEGLYVALEPLIDEIKVYDEPNTYEIFRYHYGMKRISWLLLLVYEISKVPAYLGGVTLPFTGFPFVSVMSGNAWLLENWTNGTQGSSADALSSGSHYLWLVVVIDIGCLCGAYVIGHNVAQSNRGMLRLMWRQSRTRMCLLLGTNLVYCCAAAAVQANPHHLSWLILRTSIVAFFTASDAVSVSLRLRFPPRIYAKRFGSTTGKKGKISWLLNIIMLNFLVFDALRHFMISVVREDSKVFSFGVVSPLSGEVLGISNRELLGLLYTTSTLFLAQSVWIWCTTFWGASTILLQTRFAFSTLRKDDTADGGETVSSKSQPTSRKVTPMSARERFDTFTVRETTFE